MRKDKNNWDEKLEAVIAAPRSHRVLLENSSVRVVEVNIKPGQKEPYHTHEWPSVMIIDSSSKLMYYDSQGHGRPYPARKVDTKNPHVEWLGPEDKHAVENIDDRNYHAIRIEIKS